ncbi:hypothetical protein FHS72_001569 [Loktanella ponticola]|uniref:Uncharacterized protein n=1 Tax=Yoonia ponticola TaxID=1524255 RepID=A0A7W9EZA1_9RHOB|nr:hypothetical protein [Yoonia ponticola]MBB5721945.1 hypothetical protein [Yoonia ponticola]
MTRFLLLSLPLLAACGSGSSTPLAPAPRPMAVSVNASEQLNGTLDLSVDKATGETVFVLNGVEETNLTIDAEGGYGEIKYVTDTNTVSYTTIGRQGNLLTYDENRIYGAQALSDDAIAVLTLENLTDSGALVLERLSATTVPLSGSATMTGDYFGYTQRGGSNSPNLHQVLTIFTGDAKLDVDFADRMVSGSITNRNDRSRYTNQPYPGSSGYSDVILNAAAIDGFGGFAGIATGGGQNNAPHLDDATVTGSFEGLLTGAKATGAIGAIEIVTIDPNGLLIDGELAPRENLEVGIFSVSE